MHGTPVFELASPVNTVISLKPTLSVSQIGTPRMIVGILSGILFASLFYLATVSVTRPGLVAVQNNPALWAHSSVDPRQSQPTIEIEGYDPPQHPVIVGPTSIPTPSWVEPFWAGFAAAFGQALMLLVWFLRPTRRRTRQAGEPFSLRSVRADYHARGGVALGLMWSALFAMFLGKLWLLYAMFISRANLWGSAFGEGFAPDPFIPFVPFGLSSGVLVLFMATEPWRGIRLDYRCGWWPAVSVVVTLVFGATLYGMERWIGSLSL